ncbi:hypothetical protein StoSoilB19_06110 [Arthrobacter sp. StoSoilB19]|nr:hypothetical protein StoSoilB19_06110 [Arthrobacter sp. StoSoilB19]
MPCHSTAPRWVPGSNSSFRPNSVVTDRAAWFALSCQAVKEVLLEVMPSTLTGHTQPGRVRRWRISVNIH